MSPRIPIAPPALAVLALAAASPAPAAGPLTLSTEIRVEQRVAAPDGTTRIALVAPKQVAPGDRVVFVLDYRNNGTQPLSNVVLANPVPRNILYRAAAAGSAAPEVSVDGKTYGTLGALRTGSAAGGTRLATSDDVTAVRWRLTSPIAAGSHGQLAFQAVVR